MDNSPHKGVYQLNYAENLTTKKAWNVAMVICVIQVRREKLKMHALITVWMQCSVHKSLFSLTSRSGLFWNRLATIMFIIKSKAHSGCLIKRAL